jgi:hypothetical protein
LLLSYQSTKFSLSYLLSLFLLICFSFSFPFSFLSLSFLSLSLVFVLRSLSKASYQFESLPSVYQSIIRKGILRFDKDSFNSTSLSQIIYSLGLLDTKGQTKNQFTSIFFPALLSQPGFTSNEITMILKGYYLLLVVFLFLSLFHSSCFRLLSSCFLLLASCFLLLASCFLLLASCFLLLTLFSSLALFLLFCSVFPCFSVSCSS